MIEVHGATVLLMWATGGLFFLWVTSRRREVGIGYGWTMRLTYLVIGALGIVTGIVAEELARVPVAPRDRAVRRRADDADRRMVGLRRPVLARLPDRVEQLLLVAASVVRIQPLVSDAAAYRRQVIPIATHCGKKQDDLLLVMTNIGTKTHVFRHEHGDAGIDCGLRKQLIAQHQSKCGPVP